jgi:putative membrane protein
MQQRKNLNRMLGVAALAMMFGSASVYAQSTGSTSSGTAGSNTQSGAMSGSSSATGSSGASKGANSSVARADQKMMRDLAQANLAEIATGKLALEKSQNDQVKTFAQKMIDDHTQSQKELEQLAQQKGVTLPTEPDTKHKAAAKALSALEGDKFDKMYMSQAGVRDHKNTHQLLAKAQKNAKDADVKAMAEKTTPIVDNHLTMAQDQTGKKSSSSGSSSSRGSSASGSGSSSSSK